ncbi:MAG: helix-turn-helix transcriptional regulator [Rhodobacteraceae bacterium]|nr:helix-turn-helix transcriptional regulator [Paracoccaceae bacterium]
MVDLTRAKSRIPATILVLIAVQAFCAVFFVGDVLADLRDVGMGSLAELHFGIETIATLSLVAAIVIELQVLLRLLRRKAHLEHSLHIAGAAVQAVIDAHFDAWALSPSERDVATFLVKGLSTAEIAQMRGNAEGTIKAHLNAIYRKSGTRSRSDLLSLIIDSLMTRDASAGTPEAAEQPHPVTGFQDPGTTRS